jgi:hypothetical protein
MATTAVEKSKTRSDLAQLAGTGPISAVSVLAGVLVGYATFALLLGGAIAVLRGNGSQLDLSENWGDLSARGGLLLGGLLFLSYLLAGYMAGRMAWRRGAAHGVLVFLGSILLVGVAAALVRVLTQPDDVEGITEALRSFGVPTTSEEWRNVAPVVWIASLAGMFLGSVIGGLMGERWFSKVSRRALDAEVDLRERMAASSERLAPVDDSRPSGRASDAVANGDADVDMDGMTREELYERAQQLDIAGRSHMTKDELKDALQNQSSG